MPPPLCRLLRPLLPSSRRAALPLLLHRNYTPPAVARLNLPIDYDHTPLLAHTSTQTLSNPELPLSVRQHSKTHRQNVYQAINAALAHSLASDPSVLLFGEDVAFGGVFRCSVNLAGEHGGERVFNTPLCEQGIVGFAIGAWMQGMRPVAEIQFADYVYPAFDQLVNEAAKVRYREGDNWREGGGHEGGLVVRMPCGGVGHGGLYHSQSPEALFTHIPGLITVVPRSPVQAKGLLLAAIQSPDPVIFMEPKILYRAAVEQVPLEPYTLPLCKAEVLRPGSDITIVSYGTPLYTCAQAIDAAEKDFGVKVELIDLRTVHPWDRETVVQSVAKTGRCIVVHESMVNAGVGAEVAASVQEGCFLRLQAPVQRVCGWTVHNALGYEKFHIPDVVRVYDAIRKVMEY